MATHTKSSRSAAIARLVAASAFICTAPFVVAGELAIVGTGDGMDILRELGVAYTKTTPSTTISVPPSVGSGGGIAAVGSGKAVVARVARDLTEAERERGLVHVPFARLPSVFFVDAKAGVSALSAAQTVAIFEGRVTNWKDVGGNDLRVRVVRREDSDSTLIVLRSTMPGWKDAVLTPQSKLATTTHEAVEAVRNTSGAIGFGPYSKDGHTGLSVLKIDGTNPVDPRYPSAVVLAFVYADAKLNEDAKGFLSFAKTAQAREAITQAGGVPNHVISSNDGLLPAKNTR